MSSGKETMFGLFAKQLAALSAYVTFVVGWLAAGVCPNPSSMTEQEDVGFARSWSISLL
jgi:hypothetical protein